MIESIILEESKARSRYRSAPLLPEREQFLSHLLGRGMSLPRVRSVSGYMIQIIRLWDSPRFERSNSTKLRRRGSPGLPIEDRIEDEGRARPRRSC
jgi:hypothetical protein